MENENLVGKLYDVDIGDIISLKNIEKGIVVGGYVKSFNKDLVRISYENPFGKSYSKDEQVLGLKKDKNFKLSFFKDYEVLKDNNQESTEIYNGQIKDINIGDLILLDRNNYHITGFVLEYSARNIKLSHENPNNKTSVIASRYRTSEFMGDKTFPLKFFKSSQVLSPIMNLR